MAWVQQAETRTQNAAAAAAMVVFHKTRMCLFFRNGNCTRGAHSPNTGSRKWTPAPTQRFEDHKGTNATVQTKIITSKFPIFQN
eukprot:4360341-Amphidinium_carterae.1